MATGPIQPKQSQFNEIHFDKKSGEVVGKKSFFGKIYKAIHGETYISGGSKKKITAELKTKMEELVKEAKTTSANPDESARMKGRGKLLDRLEEIKTVYLALNNSSLESLHDVGDIRKAIKLKLHSAPKEGGKVDDLKQNVDFAKAAATDTEKAFIGEKRSSSPTHAKKMAHFELLQKATDDLAKSPQFESKKIKVGDREFTYYKLPSQGEQDKDGYQYLGHATKMNDLPKMVGLIDDDKIKSTLCTSLIDEKTNFFFENKPAPTDEESKIFLVLSVPPQAIEHTSTFDIQSPMHDSTFHGDWYDLNAKINVLSAHVDDVFRGFAEGKEGVSMSTDIDRYVRLRTQVKDYSSFVGDKNAKGDNGDLAKLKDMIDKPSARSDKGEISKLVDKLVGDKVLDKKDGADIKSFLHELHKLETSNPEFKTRGFDSNRPLNKVKTMISYYNDNIDAIKKDGKLKDEYIKLFGKDDPSGKYDIVQELKQLKSTLEGIKKDVGGFDMRMNTIMNPHEMLGETKAGVHNEIDIDLRGDTSAKVRAIIISEDTLTSMKPENLEKVFAEAEKLGLPVLVRERPNKDLGPNQTPTF